MVFFGFGFFQFCFEDIFQIAKKHKREKRESEEGRKEEKHLPMQQQPAQAPGRKKFWGKGRSKKGKRRV